MRQIKLIFWRYLTYIVALGVLLVGCADPVASHYVSMQTANVSEPRECTQAKILSVRNINKHLLQLMQNSYVQIGYSSWDGAIDDIKEQILKQAATNGACLVLVSQVQSGSEVDEVPTGGYYPSPFFGGVGFTTYAPYVVPLYKIDIIFLTQMEHFSTGLYVTELDNKSRQTIGSNKGVQVTLVVNNTSAYNAGIIPGDIITKIGKYDLSDYASYDHAVKYYQGQEIPFVIKRNSLQLKKLIYIE